MRSNTVALGLMLAMTLQGCGLMRTPMARDQASVAPPQPEYPAGPPRMLSEQATQEIVKKSLLKNELAFVVAVDKKGHSMVLAPDNAPLEVVKFPYEVKQIDGPPITETTTFLSRSPSCPMRCIEVWDETGGIGRWVRVCYRPRTC